MDQAGVNGIHFKQWNLLQAMEFTLSRDVIEIDCRWNDKGDLDLNQILTIKEDYDYSEDVVRGERPACCYLRKRPACGGRIEPSASERMTTVRACNAREDYLRKRPACCYLRKREQSDRWTQMERSDHRVRCTLERSSFVRFALSIRPPMNSNGAKLSNERMRTTNLFKMTCTKDTVCKISCMDHILITLCTTLISSI